MNSLELIEAKSVELGKIHNHIIKSTKKLATKSLIDKLSNKVFKLEFKSNNSIKDVVEKILPTL